MFIQWYRWGRVTHICVGKLIIIGSDNGLSPDRRQAIIWTNSGLLSNGPLRTYFNENLIKMQQFSSKKMHVKMSSGKWRPFCFGLNVLMEFIDFKYFFSMKIFSGFSVYPNMCMRNGHVTDPYSQNKGKETSKQCKQHSNTSTRFNMFWYVRGLFKKSMWKNMLVKKDFLAWFLVGWGLCYQPVKIQVWNSLLTNMGLTWKFLCKSALYVPLGPNGPECFEMGYFKCASRASILCYLLEKTTTLLISHVFTDACPINWTKTKNMWCYNFLLMAVIGTGRYCRCFIRPFARSSVLRPSVCLAVRLPIDGFHISVWNLVGEIHGTMKRVAIKMPIIGHVFAHFTELWNFLW